MHRSKGGTAVCYKCGAVLSDRTADCKTCELFDAWNLAVETSNTESIVKSVKAEDILLIVSYLRRLRDKLNSKRNARSNVRRTASEFDFALQEIERTARNLELTSVEAIGVLEMVKQSFVEEMLYDDYPLSEDTDDDDEDDEDEE